jgi:hypothetical protein
MAIREDYWPAGVTMVRADYTEDRPVVAREPGVFEPPPGPSRSRAVKVGSSGCSLTQELYDDGPVRDAHYTPRDLAAEAAAITQAARDSILTPARFDR